ncbi:MAG TPA: bifunctional glutamate N-acetyltransferase/amino-acid acetyltransferase ArgJ [Vicinamibacterales bacterium]|jgi:glutamate N-acetyltransferase / amino-acid N-acetyltransferase|nr:bifunctional glutamate N-acetyltransferase/amino-acid acetyltransferase ArgJ [Vicinamibacterales bacterium]
MADVMPAARQTSITPVDGGITAPTGFKSAALHCGIKAKPGALDLAVIATDTFASMAGIFTTNLAQAAPVLVSKQHLEATHGVGCAIVVNSGCANACTGAEGLANAKRMTEQVADALGCPPEHVLVASTGVIGVGLPMERVIPGIQQACSALARGSGGEAARAIMTTDPFPKEHSVRVTTSRGSFVVGAMAKGSGMIEPNMATMLGFITTDAQVPPAMLHRALVESARDTFNAITVDGECSTNDSLFAMASGSSGTAIDEELYPALLDGLLSVSEPLALGIVRGGEGATKVMAVSVYDARTIDDARQVARTIANSPLVKTAVHGADPNWGRIVAAAGRSGVTFDMQKVTVRVGGILLFENGLPHDESSPKAAEILKRDTVDIEVSLGGGAACATIWGCDLSAEYVRINGEYRT